MYFFIIYICIFLYIYKFHFLYILILSLTTLGTKYFDMIFKPSIIILIVYFIILWIKGIILNTKIENLKKNTKFHWKDLDELKDKERYLREDLKILKRIQKELEYKEKQRKEVETYIQQREEEEIKKKKQEDEETSIFINL